MKKRIPKEAEEQKMLIMFLETLKDDNKIIDFHSIPNENILSFLDRKLFIIAQQKLKSMGAKKGIPDIYIYLNNKLLLIELKRKKKSLTRISKEQKYYYENFNKLPYISSYIAYGFDDAKKIIIDEINLENKQID